MIVIPGDPDFITRNSIAAMIEQNISKITLRMFAKKNNRTEYLMIGRADNLTTVRGNKKTKFCFQNLPFT